MSAFLPNDKARLREADRKFLSRAVTLVENEAEGYEAFLESLDQSNVPVIGITGPPGAGKSTLTDALIEAYIKQGLSVAVVCVDPSSPFNQGALLGDRVRMMRKWNEPNVYIRSLAGRGTSGGLSPKTLEIADVMKNAGFDRIVIETIGIGQTEIDIASLADATVLVLVPESGDEIQTMKSGVMEIADLFVVNKADRPGANETVKNLKSMLAPAFSRTEHEIRIMKTQATSGEGVAEVVTEIEHLLRTLTPEKKNILLAEKAFRLLQQKRMKGISTADLRTAMQLQTETNLYLLVRHLEDRFFPSTNDKR